MSTRTLACSGIKQKVFSGALCLRCGCQDLRVCGVLSVQTTAIIRLVMLMHFFIETPKMIRPCQSNFTSSASLSVQLSAKIILVWKKTFC